MKKFLTFIFLLLLVLAVIGYFLPTKYEINKSISINSTPEHIHEYVGDLAKWQTWTIWKNEDPDIEIILNEKTTGVGAGQKWNDKHGGGSLVFTSWSVENGIEYDLFFQSGKYKCKSIIKYISRDQNTTKVNWVLQGDTKTPIIGAYLALLMKYSISTAFTQGLNNLKIITEKEK